VTNTSEASVEVGEGAHMLVERLQCSVYISCDRWGEILQCETGDCIVLPPSQHKYRREDLCGRKVAILQTPHKLVQTSAHT
jgi:hypothetical protein